MISKKDQSSLYLLAGLKTKSNAIATPWWTVPKPGKTFNAIEIGNIQMNNHMQVSRANEKFENCLHTVKKYFDKLVEEFVNLLTNFSKYFF